MVFPNSRSPCEAWSINAHIPPRNTTVGDLLLRNGRNVLRPSSERSNAYLIMSRYWDVHNCRHLLLLRGFLFPEFRDARSRQ
jgi:hypothetical protein